MVIAMPLPPEIQLLSESIQNLRADLMRMEERLGARIDAIHPYCAEHERRLNAAEQSIVSMDAQRKTILGMVAFAGTLIGSIVAYSMKYLFGGQ